MAGEDLVQFPRGQVSVSGSPSYQMTDYTHKHVNGAKLASTLRKDPAGFKRGVRAISGSFNLIIDEDGEEMDFDTAVAYMIPQQLVLKLPGNRRKTINCVFTETGDDITLEDGVKKPVSFVGYLASI